MDRNIPYTNGKCIRIGGFLSPNRQHQRHQGVKGGRQRERDGCGHLSAENDPFGIGIGNQLQMFDGETGVVEQGVENRHRDDGVEVTPEPVNTQRLVKPQAHIEEKGDDKIKVKRREDGERERVPRVVDFRVRSPENIETA